ncbi:shikimate dehydrogenase [Methylophilus rhizosphaerae]|uniref:Shikimate dehydrogenase (NADP(+)) n=2 Tax=Methylophilus rhizosphaerae TaxID=492660 RepID=A0A1G9EFP6_9PROT|nr:shikimate dehydrogenase [Methylophilus rhizosphaerae]
MPGYPGQTNFRMTVEKYAVIGHPIAHSKSPLIHQAFAAQFGKVISYEKILAPLDGFTETVHRLQAESFLGANVTVPFKFEAFNLCNSLSERAQALEAGAVNTLSFLGEGQIRGDNTDGAGLRRDIENNLGFSIAGKRLLMLGAGGAAQGVLGSLLDAAQIVIANRTPGKALPMVAAIRHSLEASASTFEALDQSFDLVINATSAGLTDSKLPIPDCVFTANTLAYDMMYGRDTPFMQQARTAGAQVADGLGMLVEQAAEAFHSWHGLRPQTAPVIKSFRQF